MGRLIPNRTSLTLFWLVLIIGCFIIPSSALAQDEKKDYRPERGIAVYTEFSGVILSKGEAARMDLILENRGRSDETIDVKISAIPQGWKAQLKGGSYLVTGMYVPSGKTKNLALNLEPDKTVGFGSYVFQFDAQTSDGKFTSSHKLTVDVQERMTGADDIQITTSYPVLRGQTDARFEFSFDVTNKSENDRTLNLAAIGPEKWEINFKPAYEAKQISSLRLKGGQTQTVAMEVGPAKDALPGEFPILVRVSSGDRKAEAKFMLILTGIYKLDAGTASGILSLETLSGKPVSVSIFVKNTGSAINRGIMFNSFKPENWEVTFNPDKIDMLEPNATKFVEMTIKPSPQAVVGDYSVGMMVVGEKTDKTIEFRVTAKASTAWGWIGIGIIIFVIAGLSALFIWLGRR